MGIALLALVGVFLSAYLTLHRFGVVGSLVCGTTGGCDTVQNSEFATFAGVPVPLIGLGGYLLLLGVALAGLRPELTGDRRITLALLALSGIAFAFTAYLTYLEAFVIHAWCRWCIGSAVIVTLAFLLAVTEALRGGVGGGRWG
jgi:uncharacterized membrane protein